MRKETLLFYIGLIVFSAPLLGVPLAWKEVGLFVGGALVMFIALLARIEVRRRERKALDAAYIENQPTASGDGEPQGYYAVEEETYARQD